MNNLNEDYLSKNLNINESIEYNKKKQSILGGIDPERILNKEYLISLGDFYKCSICFKIMIKPTDCEECGHSYCQECISKLKCPFGCENKSLKNSSIGIINLLKNLKFNCLNEGCSVVIPYIDVKNHDINCEYQKVLCTNKKCGKKVVKKELENHIENICKYTLIKCNYCLVDYYRKEINGHEKLCALTFQYLKNYNNRINDININANININEKNFNKYIKSLSVNISKIVKENNNFKNINENKNKDKNKNDIKNIKDNKNINENIIINENKKDEIIKDNDKQKKNININDNKNNDESKQSLAQIEEDDLVDIIKKALDEKLSERFVKYDINFNEFCKYLADLKGYVCKLNTIEEVKESEEEDNDCEDNNNMKSFCKEKKRVVCFENNENENYISIELLNNIENKSIYKIDINNIKDDLKNIIDTLNLKIKNNIIKLNLNILNSKKENNNNDIYENKEEKTLILEDINIKIDNFSNKIINYINDYKIKMDNINENLNKITNYLVNLPKNKDINSINIEIIDKIKTVIYKIVDKSNNESLETIKSFNPKINLNQIDNYILIDNSGTN